MNFPVAKFGSPVLVAVAFSAIVAGAVAIRFHSRAAAPEAAAPASAPTAAPVFNERLDGRRYDNRDLGVRLTVPEGWTGTLGDRSQDRQLHDGLVVRLTPGAPAESGRFQPLVTVVKRSRSASGVSDPLAYIAKQVLTPEKSVVEAPEVVTLSGRRVARVTFEVKSGPTLLRVLQVVHFAKDDVLILSATAPSGSFADWRDQFEKVFESLKLES